MLTALLRLFVNTLVILLGVALLGIGMLGFSGRKPEASGLQVQNRLPDENPSSEGAPFFAEQTAINVPPPADQSPTEIPTRLQIPAIQLDAQIVPALEKIDTLSGNSYLSWQVPEGYLAGWHGDSARLGEAGNVVLNGHHNVNGQVFAHLIDLEGGEEILVWGTDHEYRFRVIEKVLLPERDQPIEVRLENSRWILPTSAPRLTLVTCWPYQTNTHRLIIIAEPVQ